MEYLRSVLLAAAVSVTAGLLLPEKNERLRRVLEFGISLLLLCVICRPLASLGELSAALDGLRLPSGTVTAEGIDPDTLAAMEGAVGEGIVQDLATRYGVSTACFSAVVRLAIAEGEMTVSSLTLTVRGAGRLLDLYAVRAYAEAAYQTNCEVITDGG